MVAETAEKFIDICVDTAMASEGAVSYDYLINCPAYEASLIRNKISEINKKRASNMPKFGSK